MSLDRQLLKAAISALLDALAAEHPLGHQNAYARRYVLTSRSGKRFEVMFEQSPKTPANIWFENRFAGALAASSIRKRISNASDLYTTPGKNGQLQYGRHSALETMPVLGSADLVCITPETLEEAGQVLDWLLEL